MSPRSLDPDLRDTLVDIAARLLAAEGPQALTTRRVAAEAGSSTMVLYTHFGSLGDLVREVVREGFARLQDHLTRVRATDDPVADTALLGRAYRRNALANPHLYSVMFGSATLGGFSLSEEDRHHGRYTLANVVESAARCVASGRFRAEDPELVAHRLWSAIHGLITLELGGYLVAPYDAPTCFESQLVALMVGSGDAMEAATASVAASGLRLDEIAGAVGSADGPPARPGRA
ncbi:TetR/AcrR family transcriptional regulator [Actinomadura kijaniata]|uniref:TetR/AcrR family transcriptional regulator n=1 Tax=Actinomadura kijaniata TaxID=46161 RepID=UPI00082F163A|nr:TetR/AcrR family transcriptional regulator [Actinomadura kijaniata]